mgnify:CR=1 FL=1
MGHQHHHLQRQALQAQADSLGADMISSSLGYSLFDDAAFHHSYADMNGIRTRIFDTAEYAKIDKPGERRWSAEEVRTYEELWEYRQRWGAINLEPEERQLLRKAEARYSVGVKRGDF